MAALIPVKSWCLLPSTKNSCELRQLVGNESPILVVPFVRLQTRE